MHLDIYSCLDTQQKECIYKSQNDEYYATKGVTQLLDR
jgi:hypothetical protein